MNPVVVKILLPTTLLTSTQPAVNQPIWRGSGEGSFSTWFIV